MADEISIEKYANLVEGLYRKTEDNSIIWVSSVIYDGFETTLANRIILLSQIAKPKGQAPDYEIQILRPSDYEMIDSFRDTNLSEASPPQVDNYSTYFQVMKHMYGKIARRLSGADAALEEILNELNR